MRHLLAPAFFAALVTAAAGCTAIAIDGAASVDGSAFAGMNADDSDADFRLTYVPARQHSLPSTRPVYRFDLKYPRWVGFGRGAMFHPRAGHQASKPVGEIPEVASTFGYYEAAEPLINDQGLGIGESSCASMLVNKVAGDEGDAWPLHAGLLDTVSLMQLALERCASARCAVEVMGNQSEAFGFIPTPGESTVGSVRGRRAWDDVGEAFTLADASGEAWVFHVIGGVRGVTKSVWAAQRVPLGHFAVVANEFIIGDLPNAPNGDFMFNRAIFRAARAAGLWDGKGALHFAKTFAPDPMAFEAPAGTVPLPLYASLRRWGLMNLAAPSLALQFSPSNLDYPFSVKVERRLSHRDVMPFLRYVYEGTEFDMTQGILAGPFRTPFRLEGNPDTGQFPRAVPILRTAYSVLVHTGPERQLAWFAADTPLTSVYVPLYSRSSAVARPFSVGSNRNFSRESAWWAFDFVNNYMQLRYSTMSQEDVYPAIERWQDEIDRQRKSFEQADSNTLDSWQRSLQDKLVADWWNLADFLVVKYNDGYINVPTPGEKRGYPQWYADMVGFSNDVHPVWVRPAARPPSSVPGYVPPAYRLPTRWDPNTSSWSREVGPPAGSPVPQPALVLARWAGPLQTALASLAAFGVGLLGGRNYERCVQGGNRRDEGGAGNGYSRLC